MLADEGMGCAEGRGAGVSGNCYRNVEGITRSTRRGKNRRGDLGRDGFYLLCILWALMAAGPDKRGRHGQQLDDGGGGGWQGGARPNREPPTPPAWIIRLLNGLASEKMQKRSTAAMLFD